MLTMLRTIDCGGAPLADAIEKGIAGERRSNEGVARHAAKLPTGQCRCKERRRDSFLRGRCRLGPSDRTSCNHLALTPPTVPTRLVPSPRGLFAALALLAAACGASTANTPDGGAPAIARDTRNLSFDPAPIYRQMGLIARGLPFPIVGRVGFLASSNPDTTHVVLALGFSSTSLTFTREADNRFRALYSVSLSADRGQNRVFVDEANETVIVSTFRETSRMDENLLYQQVFDLAPGTYRLAIAIRDGGSQRSVEETIELTVPSLGAGELSTPIPIHEVRVRASRSDLPDLLTRPRASVVFGRDSTVPMYVEGYGASDTLLTLIARSESGRTLFSHTVPLTAHDGISSGVVEVPVGSLGIGVAQLAFATSSGRDTTASYIFVGFGDDFPVARFEDMLSFLRHFATASRLQALRTTPEEDRPSAWATFLRETDSIPETPEHEDLANYFSRIVRANARFRDESVPGWMSDRGRVFIVLGEPDRFYEPPGGDFQQTRQQLWEYSEKGLQLVFYDQTGTGQWRLTQTSAVRFESEYRRQLR